MKTFTAITRAEIIESNLLSNSAVLWALDNIDYLNKPMKFFGTSTKIEKRKGDIVEKFEIFVMYLQPANKVALKTICNFAVKAGCKNPCLIDSGMLGLTTGQNAATKRTILFLLRRAYFDSKITKEIASKEKRAARLGIPVYFRLNGTSDINFSELIANNPNSKFYDYTKLLARVRRNTLPNYDLTFSGSMYSKQSKAALSKAIARGEKIAIAFNSAGIKSDSLKIPVKGFSSFDDNDARFLNGAGEIGTLSRKGSNKTERAETDILEKSFFVTSANITEFNNIIARG
ncbi:hypothetical protein DRH27_05570 [Candidatus Falkowbacteria bacterium]|nr:MAG: hypothetical protein DRH27_05570 [Candidatus Falkowbacteria bacterium]